MSVPTTLNHREALELICKVCYESSEQSRRLQVVHEAAMVALGYVLSQRQTRHAKAMQRSEEFKENMKVIGTGEAKRQFKQQYELDTGMKRQQYKKWVLR